MKTKEQQKDYDRTYYAANREKRKEQNAAQYPERYSRPDGRAGYLLQAARTRAKKCNVPCTITLDWVRAKLQPGICEMTGVPFSYARPAKGMHRNPFSPSLDRIDSAAGYTPENTRIVTTQVNLARNEWSDAVLFEMARRLMERLS